jgi:myo-inositol-1(or 4)-monophosphatase
MPQIKKFNYKTYFKFLNNLAKELTRFYNKKLSKSFQVTNKLKGRGYDPVTSSDKAFERFIRSKITKKFPEHQIIGEEFGKKISKSEYSWVIDPIDGTRSYVIGNPSWSNLISLNYKGIPIIGLANFPSLKKYYINFNHKVAYKFENGKRKKIKVNNKVIFKKARIAGAFHGVLSLKKQMKIPKVLKLLQFPCFDALSYSHMAEGKLDIVIQCGNKIWDIHPLIPIIRAAGGKVSTWKGDEPINGGKIIVANNERNKNQMIKLLKTVS